jgi:hypothetical protein
MIGKTEALITRRLLTPWTFSRIYNGWSMLLDSRFVPHQPLMLDLLQSDGNCTGRSILFSGARVPAG